MWLVATTRYRSSRVPTYSDKSGTLMFAVCDRNTTQQTIYQYTARHHPRPTRVHRHSTSSLVVTWRIGARHGRPERGRPRCPPESSRPPCLPRTGCRCTSARPRIAGQHEQRGKRQDGERQRMQCLPAPSYSEYQKKRGKTVNHPMNQADGRSIGRPTSVPALHGTLRPAKACETPRTHVYNTVVQHPRATQSCCC